MNSVKQPISPAHPILGKHKVLTAILCSFLLSGCQHLPPFFTAESSDSVKPITEINSDKHEYSLSQNQQLIGKLFTINTQADETLSDVARHFGLGYNDIVLANPHISPWVPTPGSKVLLPMQFILPESPHQGITLNLANMRMFYYPKNSPNKVVTYPVGIGRDGWNTPTGLLKIISKTANPTWTVPESILREHQQKGDPLPAAIKAGPNNPLGAYAMRLTIPGYLIHGTNKPYGIGMQVSHGCIQMYPEDIEVLFGKTAIGTPVQIVHQPYLTAWDNGMLYLEANQPLQNAKQAKEKILKQLRQIAAQKAIKIDWPKVEQIITREDGIPTPILANSPNIAELSAQAIVLSHPEHLNHLPLVDNIDADDWAILVKGFSDPEQARKLVSLLNHQGPMIPARQVVKNKQYQVIAGPFKNKIETLAAVKRIQMDFEIKAKLLKPGEIRMN